MKVGWDNGTTLSWTPKFMLITQRQWIWFIRIMNCIWLD